MENKFTLDIDHNNAKHMEYFLRAIKYPLEEKRFDQRHEPLNELIIGGAKFQSIDLALPITITLIFCDSYEEATKVGKNYISEHVHHGVNGDVLYVVESEDEEKVNELLGLFAGEE